MQLHPEYLKWALVAVSNAPIQNTTEAKAKAYWLQKFASDLEPERPTSEPGEH